MDPVSALQNAIAIVQQVKMMVDTLEECDIQATQLSLRLNQIALTLDRAMSCSSSVTTIVSDINRIIGSEKDKKGLLGYLVKYQEKKYNPSVFGYVKRLVKSSDTAADLEKYNNMLDRVLQNLELALGVSTNRKLNDLTQTLSSSHPTTPSSLETMYALEPLPSGFGDERCVLGRGAFATTYRVKKDGHLYAMKQVKITTLSNTGLSTTAIQNEVHLLIRLTHVHVIRYFLSFETADKLSYNIVMELADGGNMSQQVKVKPAPSLAMIKKWLQQSLMAFQYMHSEHNIVHRDIKPENVLLTSGGDVKIADFGLACAAETNRSRHSVLGTMLYASYEKAHGLSYDGRDDLWGLGCVFLEVVTRKTLHEWGGALYEHTSEDVKQRRRAAMLQCEKTCTSLPELNMVIATALNVDVDGRGNSEELLHLIERKHPPTLSTIPQAPSPIPQATPIEKPNTFQTSFTKITPNNPASVHGSQGTHHGTTSVSTQPSIVVHTASPTSKQVTDYVANNMTPAAHPIPAEPLRHMTSTETASKPKRIVDTGPSLHHRSRKVVK